MRRRHRSLIDSSASNTSPGKNLHLSDERLLLALDGELSSHEAARVAAHLEACWSCRVRSQQIERTIADILEYRDFLIRPHLPLSTGGVESFVVRLERLARTVGQSSFWSRVAGYLRVLRTSLHGLAPRHAWISALVIISFALFLFIRFWEVPKVSASQLLENSQVFEVRKLQGVTKPVVYQKLRIRIGAKAVTRTIYRDSVGMRQVDVDGPADGLPGRTETHSEDLHSAESELQRTFFAAHLNWQDPLSLATYKSWHDGLREKHDEITTGSQEFLILKTTTSESPIAEAQITFRAADFHPIQEELRLQDTREVEIKELAWDVLPMEAVNPAIFSPSPAVYGETEHSRNMPPPPPGPSDAQLAEAELQARIALHVAGADLGEQIEFDRDASGSIQRSVLVKGIVSTQGRKNELLGMFQGIPHVELRLQTLEEANAQQNQTAADRVQDGTLQVAQQMANGQSQVHGKNADPNGSEAPAVGSPAFELQLEERYPKSEDRIAFINTAVEVAQDALAQAWALRRLKDRYTPVAVAELSRGSQRTLELLIRDHVSLLLQRVGAARDLLSPLFPAGSLDEVPQPTVPEMSESAVALTNDWRSAVTESFSETQKVWDSVVVMFAGAGATDSETPAHIHSLQAALAKLQTQLPVLYKQVSQPWSEPTSSLGSER